MEKILQKYKNDLKKFIEINSLDKENFSDIEERINEKLSKIENPTESDIKNILHEIWSPEEIFAEELWEKMIRKPKNLWEKIKQKTDKIIFLWVFYELGKKTWISGNIYRIMFLFLFAVWFLAWIWEIIVFLIFSYIFWFLFLRTWIIRFFFSGFLGFICVIIAIPAIILLWFFISNFHIENIYPFMEISYLLPIWLGIWIFSMIILAIFFFYYAFFGRTFWVKFFLTWIISFVIAISIWIWVWLDLFSKYYGIQREEKTFEFEFKDKSLNLKREIETNNQEKNPLIDKKILNLWNFIKFNNDEIIFNKKDFKIIESSFYYWEISYSENEKTYVTISKNTFWSSIFLEKYKDFVKNYELKQKDNSLELKVEFDTSKKYPLIPVNFKLSEIKIPKNTLFNAKYWQLKDKEIIFKDKEKNEKYAEKVFRDCEKYFFDDNWKLNCEDKEAEKILKQTKENFVEN